MTAPLDDFIISAEKAAAECASADGKLIVRLIQQGVQMLHTLLVQSPARQSPATTASPALGHDEVAELVRRAQAWVTATKNGNDDYARRSLVFIEDVLHYYQTKGRLSEKQIGALQRTIGTHTPGYENAGRAPLPRADFTRTHGTNGTPRKAPDRTRRGRSKPTSEVLDSDPDANTPRFPHGDTDEFTDPLN